MRSTILLLLLSIPIFSSAQNAYSFQQITSDYTPIAGANECTFNEDGLFAIPGLLGETFTLYGTSFTVGGGVAISIGEFGFLRIEDASSLIIIDGLFTYMEPIDTTSTVVYSLSGVPGSHHLVAEWRNWKLSNGPDGNFVNFQLSLDQQTGVAEVRIGPNSGGGELYTSLSGPNCGIFHAPHTFSQCFGKLWIEGDGDSPTLDTLSNFDFDALVSLPSPNTIFRFTPNTIGNAIVEAEEAIPFTYQVRQNSLEITMSDRSSAELQLIDPSGRTVRSATAAYGSASILITDLPAGVYILRSERYSVAVPLRL